MVEIGPFASGNPEEVVAGKLRALSGFRGPITPETDVLYDIRLGGTDLCELLEWLIAEYGMDFSNVSKADLPLDEPPPAIKTLFGKRKYKGMTVASLLSAVQTKRWNP